MSTGNISITVDADTAQSYCDASPEERRKLDLLLRLRELTVGRVRPLKEIMDEIGAEAEAKGLTPEMLESMLGEERSTDRC